MSNVKEFIRKVFGRKREPGITVAQALAGLPEAYMVFNAVLYDHSGIDHIVFSRKQGLFLINAPAERGTVTCSGKHLLINDKERSDIIKKALKDTFWLKSTIRERIGLDVPITPVVAYENASVAVRQPLIGVTVLEAKDVLDALLHAPEKSILEDGVVMVLRELHGTHTISYRSV
ncbi:MAG: NERD domain-containing protein [Nitrospirota bacterium]